MSSKQVSYEQCHEKTMLSTDQVLYKLGSTVSSNGWRLEISNLDRYCTTYVAKTKALISCAVAAQLICAFVFAYAMKKETISNAY